jgi:hypothetical protein
LTSIINDRQIPANIRPFLGKALRSDLMHMINKRLTRTAVRAVSLFLPDARALDLERWRRGREDAWKLGRCQALFVSYGKSGRTWVRVMVSRYYQRTRGLPEHTIMGFDNYHRMDPTVPTIFFTHDNYVRAYLGHPDSRAPFFPYRTVLLVRKPQDVAVSQFFQWKFRMRPYKKALNEYPPDGADITPFDFVMHSKQGIDRVVDFLNDWNRALPGFASVHVVRYEDLRANTAAELGRIMAFLGETVDEEAVADAVAFASVERMREMESTNYFWRSGSRVQARDVSNPDSYKVRKAKVGGYRDYFTEEQIAEIDARVDARLLPGFGYTSGEAPDRTTVTGARG